MLVAVVWTTGLEELSKAVFSSIKENQFFKQQKLRSCKQVRFASSATEDEVMMWHMLTLQVFVLYQANNFYPLIC